ncbi:MAG: DEAD/DEAH box helicase family protein [Lachnospiraceae bacterium]|nr:DEAD/DEAH box helicase family protein [Lachnospiraceae bacterium]
MQADLLNKLQFHWTWRTYQKRVLDRADTYLKDKRIHVVAAPGSGKTILGIELIRRVNQACLVLAPSITIRDQWLDRIKEAYLPQDYDTAGLLSNSIKEPAIITAITYQALHSGMTKYKGKLTDEGEEGVEKETASVPIVAANPQEDVDFSDFDLLGTVRRMGIKTLCLDEAHHLRSEWWKALEELVAQIPGMTIISLTATPPYDSTPAQWQRYVGLCGPIDEEIIVPELVKEKSLCPHQDYVYFNMPTEEEKKAVLAFRDEAATIARQITMDEEFARVISTHGGLSAPKAYAEQFLENPQYLTALLVFLHFKGIVYSKELLNMIGEGTRLPAMTMQWLEILLQGFLYEDTESYSCSKEYREDMISLLKTHGLIQKKKVCLVANDEISKLITGSKGKISSILEVTRSEYENLGSDLRLLILTDYIKRDYLSAIGNLDKGVNELGVIPIFENIRRTFSGLRSEKNTTSTGERITARELRIGVLSGTIVIIPDCAKEALQKILDEEGMKGNMKECGDGAYWQVTISGSENTIASMVTRLFNEGYIRVLIGTKSLLGEGWDSPCINSLILASFVGSFMLSNQMRGRAIRTQKGNPDKVSNIWHLICMEPERTSAKEEEQQESTDFSTLRRRFEGFLGVHYEKNVIENRLDRLSYIRPPYTAPMLEKINGQMESLAADREGLRKRWDDSLAPLTDMEVAVEAGADKSYFKPGKLFFGALLKGILWTVLLLAVCGFGLIPAFVSGESGILMGLWKFILSCVVIFCTVNAVWQFAKLSVFASPDKYMKSIGNCVLKALKQSGDIVSCDVSVGVDESETVMSYIYLKGGSEREKDVFAQCIYEFFGTVEKQRYILKAKGNVPKLCKYYCVPEMFGKKKEDAQLFHSLVKKYVGNYELIYTKGDGGKGELLSARICSVANKGELCVDKKKKVVNAQ